ncbi:hypothetical protein BZG02_01995 [Labilibaculum filiforme]|uniref:DUF4412 domain-containing protein n=2 Tax=Labilibaculum filiforme TaxID=1940526 RepID=A0A2N3I664_9BACT|nr:hypothetical protein BZG02_01995 [Labilibaculum filiforme]
MMVQVTTAQQRTQKYAIKSGHVEYQLSGNTTGTKSVWWDNYGNSSFTETKSLSVTKVFGIKSETKTHTISINKDGQFWNANLIEKTGQKGTIPFQDITENMTEAEKKKMGKDILESLGGEIVGTENVLGNQCEVVKLMGATCWVYEGVTLKSEAKMLGIEAKETAVKFEKNSSVSSSKFIPPTSIKYVDQDQYQQQMFGGLSEGFSEAGYEDDDEDVEDLIPVKYPYDKFQKIANSFHSNNYRKMMVMNTQGTYSAMFMKGMSENLAVAATSRKNGDFSQQQNLEVFTHSGKKCFYGKMDDEDGISLIVDIPTYDTYIILVSSSVQSKSEMLQLMDAFNF